MMESEDEATVVVALAEVGQHDDADCLDESVCISMPESTLARFTSTSSSQLPFSLSSANDLSHTTIVSGYVCRVGGEEHS